MAPAAKDKNQGRYGAIESASSTTKIAATGSTAPESDPKINDLTLDIPSAK